MKLQLVKGTTSYIATVFIQDSSSTTGAGLGSLDQTSSITGGYVRGGATGVALSVNEDVTTEGTYQAPSTAAQVRIGTPANMPTGTYELHFHNDLFASGADYVVIGLSGATNMAPLLLEIQLTNVNLNDGVRGGMTALPNAAADAAGGLPISDAGGLDLDALFTRQPVIASGTLGATGNDTTHLHLTGLGYGDDSLNGYLIRLYDNSGALYYSTWIEDWVNSTALATVELLPITPEASVDTYVVYAVRRDVNVVQVTGSDVTGGTPDVNVTSWNGTSVKTPNTAGIPLVDIDALNGTALNGDGSATPWGP